MDAIQSGQFSIVDSYVRQGCDLNYPLTSNGITLYMLLMGLSPEFFEETPDKGPGLLKEYIHTLKTLKRKDIDLLATDDDGRTCFHHAAAVGNALGL